MTRSRTISAAAIAALALLAVSSMGLASLRKAEDKPIRALLVLGGCCHDYGKQKDILTKGISDRADVVWTIAYDPSQSTGHKNPIYDNPDWAKEFDVVVHDECSADVKDMPTIETILKPHKDGLPAVVLHCAMHCYRTEGWDKKMATPWMKLTGLITTGHGAQLPIEVKFTDKESPITSPLADWTTTNEELYNNVTGKLEPTAHALAIGKQTSERNGRSRTDETIVVWTNTFDGKAKVFGTTLGHNNQTVGDPRYLDLVTRGLLWSVGKLDEAHLKKPEASSAKGE